MEVLYPRCGALDLGKDSLVAAVRVQEGSRISRECRTFGCTTKALLELSAWLTAFGVTHVLMEATGSYWKSVWHILQPSFELVLANPTHVKNLQGKKSDVKDATWLSDLMAHGLLRGSFVPPPEIQALRELTRTRKQLVKEVVRHTQRIQRILDTANLKITGVITDVIGVSGRAIIRALIRGETDPHKLAQLARGRMKSKAPQLVDALHGRPTAHQRFLLQTHLGLIENWRPPSPDWTSK